MKRFKNNLIGFILLWVAVVLVLPLTIWNRRIVRKNRGNTDGYYLSTAVNLDIWANREFRTLWNDKLIISESEWQIAKSQPPYPFGRVEETISSALGKNQLRGTLSKKGRMLAWVLDTLDKEHCKKSIKEFEE